MKKVVQVGLTFVLGVESKKTLKQVVVKGDNNSQMLK
jgi:hypothetical protein